MPADITKHEMTANMYSALVEINVVPRQRTHFSNAAACRKQQAKENLVHIVLIIIKERKEFLQITLINYRHLAFFHFGRSCGFGVIAWDNSLFKSKLQHIVNKNVQLVYTPL